MFTVTLLSVTRILDDFELSVKSLNLTFFRSRSDHFLHSFTLGDSSHVRCYVVRKNQEYFSPKKFNLFSSDLVLYVPCFVCALHKTNVLAVTVLLV